MTTSSRVEVGQVGQLVGYCLPYPYPYKGGVGRVGQSIVWRVGW